MIDDPVMRCDHAILALYVNACANAVVVVRAIHVVLDVFARPDPCTGPSTCCAICTARTVPSNSSRRPKPPRANDCGGAPAPFQTGDLPDRL
jgi:coenzyme F420-reducing hydrogenase gamma subunit